VASTLTAPATFGASFAIPVVMGAFSGVVAMTGPEHPYGLQCTGCKSRPGTPGCQAIGPDGGASGLSHQTELVVVLPSRASSSSVTTRGDSEVSRLEDARGAAAAEAAAEHRAKARATAATRIAKESRSKSTASGRCDLM
jgi:hypothetical protein